MKEIALTQGKVAIVDDEDYEGLNQWMWYAHACRKKWYACRTLHKDGEIITLRMHRLILNTPDNKETDHINGNGLDNRRCNLRICNDTENCRNSKMRTGAKSSSFKGLDWFRHQKKWRVRISVDKKSIFLGYFNDEGEAANAYDEAAKKYHGEFANLNFKEA